MPRNPFCGCVWLQSTLVGGCLCGPQTQLLAALGSGAATAAAALSDSVPINQQHKMPSLPSTAPRVLRRDRQVLQLVTTYSAATTSEVVDPTVTARD